ncbi:RadC family protein [Caenimonas soli]|uniref:RadC family protein n=1 Tax=Caenimonas soli TaxID=2735555 RepID=UPI00155440F6|nr:DNA repair protein RadC [Caenimonas soli]
MVQARQAAIVSLRRAAGGTSQVPQTVEDEDQAIMRAILILRGRFKERDVFSRPDAVKDFLRLHAQGLTHEVFAVIYLDSQNRLIEYERVFRGTLTQTSVYPREIVKLALVKNAASVVLRHNHPSGMCLPSRADEALTQSLKAALALVDVRVLDHVITSDDGALSMAEKGLL